MINRILFISVLVVSTIGSAQNELSSFTTTGRGGATTFVTDYQAIGINPANLGWTWKFENKKVALGLGEMAYSLHSEALSKQELRDEFNAAIKNKSLADFTREEKIQAGQDFANAGLALNADIGSFGFAFSTDKLGGIAFRINDHFQWYSKLGPTASDLLFLGKTASYFDSLTIINGSDTNTIANDPSAYDYDTMNILNGFASSPDYMSQVLDGTKMSMNWYREYNLSYGRKIFEKDSMIAVYGGVGVKYLQGLGVLDIQSENGVLTAYSALSPRFDIDYGNAAAGNPSSLQQQTSGLPQAVGSGIGYDFGLNVVLFDKLKIGASYINGGSITYDGNVYSVKDTILYDTESEGLNNYNFFKSISEFTGEDGLLQWQGEQERTVKLPSVMRFGASVVIGKIAQLGFDLVMPGNEAPGSLEKAMIGFGGDVSPLPWLKLQAGFVTGGNYDTQIPVGVLITPPSGSYEIGIASRDAITFFAKNGPTLSLSTGFMRFRF